MAYDGKAADARGIADGHSEGHTGPPHIIAVTDGTTVEIPFGTLLLEADYARSGDDLLLTGTDGTVVLIQGYFAIEPRPDLLTIGGAGVPGHIAEILAGPRAAGQIAQLGEGEGREVIGEITEFDGDVTVQRTDGVLEMAEIGLPLYEDDVVQTDAGASAAVIFVDGTSFSIGGRARMVLDELAYDPGGGEARGVISILQGSFAFASGRIAESGEDALTVDTPVMTIGIRGTNAAGEILQEGELSYVILLRSEDGHVGQIDVSNGQSAFLLTEENQGVFVSSRLTAINQPQIFTQSQIESLLGPTLERLPPPDARESFHEQRSEGPQSEPPSPEELAQLFALEPGAGPETPPEALIEGSGSIMPTSPFEAARDLEAFLTSEILLASDLLGADPFTLFRGIEGFEFADIERIEDVQIQLESGRTFLVGGPGDDSLMFLDGDVTILGFDGNDIITSGSGLDLLIGSSGNDVLIGGGNNDLLSGGDGDDILFAGAGDDVVSGGAGSDTIIAGSGQGNDVYDGGEGIDTIVYSSAVSPIVVNLLGNIAQGTDIGTDTIVNIENVIAGAGGDTVIGDNVDNLLNGGPGNDTLQGVGGNDSLIGGPGTDIFLFPVAADDVDRVFDLEPGEILRVSGAALTGPVLAGTADTVPGAGIAVEAVNGFTTLHIDSVPGAPGSAPDADLSILIDGTFSPGRFTVNGSDITLNVNDAPTAGADQVSTVEDTPLSLSLADLLANDGDVDGDALAIVGFVQPLNGLLTVGAAGGPIYVPDPDFSGSDQFFYTVIDGFGGSATTAVNVTVTPVNDLPATAVNLGLTVGEGAAGLVGSNVLRADDVDNPPAEILFRLESPPDHGRVEFVDQPGSSIDRFSQQDIDLGRVQYVHDGGETTGDAFTYRLEDASASPGAVETFAISITPTNDLPIAEPDAVAAGEDTQTVISTEFLLRNDGDAESGALAIIRFEQPQNGTLSDDGQGNLIYVPVADFSGEDRFTYTVADENGGEGTASVIITVAEDGPRVVQVLDPPVTPESEFDPNDFYEFRVTGMTAPLFVAASAAAPRGEPAEVTRTGGEFGVASDADGPRPGRFDEINFFGDGDDDGSESESLILDFSGIPVISATITVSDLFRDERNVGNERGELLLFDHQAQIGGPIPIEASGSDGRTVVDVEAAAPFDRIVFRALPGSDDPDGNQGSDSSDFAVAEIAARVGATEISMQVEAQISFEFGPNGPGAIVWTDGPSDVRSEGVPIVAAISDDGAQLAGIAGDRVVYVADLDPTDGSVTFTEFFPIDHVGPNGGVTPIVALEFGFQVTDRLGNSDSGVVTVEVAEVSGGASFASAAQSSMMDSLVMDLEAQEIYIEFNGSDRESVMAVEDPADPASDVGHVLDDPEVELFDVALPGADQTPADANGAEDVTPFIAGAAQTLMIEADPNAGIV